MGYRLHVCKTYKVIHGEGKFNSDIYRKVMGIFYEECKNCWVNEEGSVIEVSFEDFKKLITKLKRNADKFKKYYDVTDLELKQIAETFQEMYDQADKDNDCIRLEWF